MEVENAILPTSKQRALLSEQGPYGPIYMINLIKYRDKAEYEDGRETNLSGKEAFQLYAHEADKMLREFNAEMIFVSNITELIMGDVEELWDEFTVVRYASRQDLLRLVRSTEWDHLNVHRAAGISGQLLIESVVPVDVAT
jgi:uncharacterized protein (DUF1330 family)